MLKKQPLKTIYLAGPDIFRPDCVEIGKAKHAICAEYGFIGSYPLDNSVELDFLESIKDIKNPTEEQLRSQTANVAMCIYAENEQKMKELDTTIANVSPFRGPSMDIGTSFELGFMKALGKPIFCYTNTCQHFMMRTRKFCNNGEYNTEVQVDENKNRFEEFITVDNLMIDASVIDSSGMKIVEPKHDIPDVHDHGSKESLALFRMCCEQIVEYNKMIEKENA